MMKKILILCITLLLLIGAVHAADTNKTQDGKNITAKDTSPVEITKKQSKISLKSVTGKEKNKVKITAKLKGSDGKLIKNAKLTFKIKGKKYSAKTNAKGVAGITYKLPKAKYLKTVKTKKGNTVAKTKIYRTTCPIKVTFKGSDKYASSSASAKAISKKSKVVKKSKRYNTAVVPLKRGDHTYRRGPVTVQVIWQKEGKMDDVWIAVDKANDPVRLQASAKLHSKNGNGQWKWDSRWQHCMSEHDLIITYYEKLPDTDKIKIRYERELLK